MIHGKRKVQYGSFDALGKRIHPYGLVVVREHCDNVVQVRFFVLDLMYGYGVYNLFPYAFDLDVCGMWCAALGLPLRKRRIDVCCPAFELDHCKVTLIFSSYTDVAVARSGTPGFERKIGDVLAFSCGRVQIIYVLPAGVVKNVFFRV